MQKLWLCFFLVAAACSSAPKIPTNFPEQKISIEARKMGARDCLVSLLQESGLRYRVPASLNNSAKITLDAREQPWADVFKMAAHQAGYTYRFTQKRVLILQPMAKAGPAVAPTPVVVK